MDIRDSRLRNSPALKEFLFKTMKVQGVKYRVANIPEIRNYLFE